MQRAVIFLLILISCFLLIADDDQSTHAVAIKNQLLFLPFLYYTPETDLAFGGASSYIFRTSKKNPALRPSSISPLLVYTLKQQFRFELLTNIYLKNDHYYLNSLFKWKYYPDLFFGLGNDTTPADQTAYTCSGLEFNCTLFRRIGKSCYAGLKYQYANWTVTGEPPLASGGNAGLIGDPKGRISGLSILVSKDNRDNIYSPRRGEFIEGGFSFYPRFLGSGFHFFGFQLNYRRYITCFTTHTLAIQALFDGKGGEVPFLFMAELGGQSFLRGYYQGRFRDKSLILCQAEYRLPLFWRLGAAGFIGAGQVMNRLTQFSPERSHWSGGVGIRYLFSKKEGITLRLDIAFSQESPSFYLSIFEAF